MLDEMFNFHCFSFRSDVKMSEFFVDNDLSQNSQFFEKQTYIPVQNVYQKSFVLILTLFRIERTYVSGLFWFAGRQYFTTNTY